jgi:hypothetical protein
MKELTNSSNISVCIPKREEHFAEPSVGIVGYFAMLSVSHTM